MKTTALLALVLIVLPATAVQADLADDLFSAARRGDAPAVNALLDANPALIAAADASGRTALHHAALAGRSEILTLLLSRGAELEAIDQRAQTALHLAARHLRLEAVQTLLAAGAAVAARDAEGRTPLHVVGSDARPDADAAEIAAAKTALAQALLAAGADANAKDHAGRVAWSHEEEPATPREPSGYPTYASIVATLQNRATTYPSLCQIQLIGTSYGGRQFYGLKITDNPTVEEDEPEHLYVANMHGDETTGLVMCLNFIDYLLQNYGTDPRVTSLVNEIEIWIVPTMNPDGYVSVTRYNGGGSDLNRTFPEGAPPNPEPNTTTGRPPEVAAMMNWSAGKSFTLAASFHGGALVANYPFDNPGNASRYTPDQDLFVYISELYSWYNQPMWNGAWPHGITNGADWYIITGGIQDWYYRYMGCNAVTMEISDIKTPAYSSMPTYWENNRESMLHYMESCLIGVRGLVRNAATQAPLAATVAVVTRDHNIFTDPDVGDYHRMLLPGVYNLTFAAAGYTTVTAYNIPVFSGPATRLDVWMGNAPPVTIPTAVTLDAGANTLIGLPGYDPGNQTMSYLITSLPALGTLSDPNGGPITDVPYTLLANGTSVRYTAGLASGGDSFQFQATDHGTPPTGGDSNTSTVNITIIPAAPVITTTTLPPGSLNGNYGPVQLEASGGAAPLVWTVLPSLDYLETNLGSSQYAAVGTAQNWRADDAVWAYTLPFSFPFYDGNYTTIRVSSNGYIDFGSFSGSVTNNSNAGLMINKMIAPMWDDLRTDGTGEDIFIHTGVSGQVTIRWKGRTFSGNYPVNFSVTLQSDGGILFHYGPNNTGQTPTIGVSRGGTTQYTLASYNGSGALTNANSLSFSLPGSLPAGMTLSSSGLLGGVPTQSGVFEPTFRVTDAMNRANERLLELVINVGPVPPIAQGTAAATPVSTPVTVTLPATDDGQPNPPGMLSYIITSLPGHGSLNDPQAGAIAAVPYTLANGGNQVVYTPTPGYRPSDSFQYQAHDGGTPPTGGGSNLATVNLTIGGPAFDPVANSQSLSTGNTSPTLITLTGSDPNGDPLTFVIESLPVGGTGLLADPVTGQIISGVPYPLPGSTVRYLPPFGQVVNAAFTFTARDATATSNVATVSLNVGASVPQVVYSFPMDVNPGWTTEGLWAFGTPTGGGSHGRDPTGGYTGANVCGYNLAGDYTNNMTVARYLTTGELNCAHLSGTTLRFRRWLAVEGSGHDLATIQVSPDGTTWTTVWQNPAAVISETAWSLQTYDLSAVADGQSAVRVRWGMGPTDASVTYPGWNIDDVEIIGVVNFSCQGIPAGDVNGDGVVDGRDIQGFAEVVLDPYAAGLTLEEFCGADVNADGFVTLDDLPLFVNLLLGL